MSSKLDQEVAKAERPHFAALDGLRGVAILLVVLRHCSTVEVSQSVRLPIIIHDNLVLSLGWGVVLFFVLSGFLITGILLDSKGSPGYFRSFYGRRVLRIFPLYYGTILIFFVAYLFHGFAGDDGIFLRRLPWLLTYTTNFQIAWHNDWSFIFNGHSLGHFWTLSVEEQFYFIWPLIVLRCETGVLKRICLIAIVGGFVGRMVLLYGCHDYLGAIVYLPCESGALAMGALLAILVRERERLVGEIAWPLTCSGAAVWMASLFDGDALVTAGVTGFGMMSAGALALCLYHPISKLFSVSILRAFGKYSYGIYVWHVIVLPFLWPLREKMGPRAFPIVFIPIAFCTGWLSWRLVEAHFLKLKKYFPVSSKRGWTPRLQPEQKKEAIQFARSWQQ